MTWFAERFDTPLGEMVAVTDEAGCLRALDWVSHRDRMDRLLAMQPDYRAPVGSAATVIGSSVQRYFNGDLEALIGLAVAVFGTAFQQNVWRALRTLPPAQTITYRTLAGQIGRPAAIRAAGAANGANPISIVVPCHRVIGSDGRLTGYGGGIARKQWLLAHEARSINGRA